jgi:predicted Rossmann fold flavoprotein
MQTIDLAIVGAGPAGMMAAIIASKRGLNVCILEKNDRLARKLLITGKGRCNVTNLEIDNKQFIDNFGKNGKFLYSCLSQFGVEDTISFFESLGLPTKVERGNRVFPASDKASDVVRVLEEELKKNKVEVEFQSKVKDIQKKYGYFEIVTNRSKINSKNVLIATGGKSYPQTGSTGDGYPLARNLGHKIVEAKPSLVPIIFREKYIKELEGLSLKNVKITISRKDKVLASRFGEALFTHNGMSGPIILDLSRELTKNVDFANCDLILSIDFKPALSKEELDKRILADFAKFKNKQFKNCLGDLLPAKIRPLFVRLSKIDPDKQVNSTTKEERTWLINLFKDLRFTIQGVGSFDEAIITSGGIDLKEINPKTMESKLVRGLYFAGEVLDLDGPTGGYNLQVCWSTGYVAGSSIACEELT